jgi:hypothetical protein
MADNEIKAEIVFEDIEMMEVQSTVAEITTDIEGKKLDGLRGSKPLGGVAHWRTTGDHLRARRLAACLARRGVETWGLLLRARRLEGRIPSPR